MFKSKVDGAAYYKDVSPDILPVAGAGQWGTDTLRQNYQNATPGQKITRFKDYKKHK